MRNQTVHGSHREGLDVDAVFTANTFHIMPWEAVAATIAGSGRLLSPGGRLMVYGPFSYGNRHTSDSNARFDAALRSGSRGASK